MNIFPSNIQLHDTLLALHSKTTNIQLNNTSFTSQFKIHHSAFPCEHTLKELTRVFISFTFPHNVKNSW